VFFLLQSSITCKQEFFIEPTDAIQKQGIKIEADFFKIQSLINILSPHKFEFVSIEREQDGILYWLGTNRGTGTYKNPCDAGFVSVTDSSHGNCAVDKSIRGDAGGCSGESVTIDFKEVEIIPSSYSLSYPKTCNCCKPRNWKIEGFNCDTKQWKVLKEHVNDASLNSRCNWKLVQSERESFTQFKITGTGEDESGDGCICFHVCSFEVYGIVLRK